MRISQIAWSESAKKRTAAADEEKVSASASAIGILKDDANTVQSKKEGRKDRRGGGMVGSAAFFGFSISEKNTLSRENR